MLFIALILQTQKNSKTKRDEKPVMDVFLRVKDQRSMISGLVYFVKKVVAKTVVAGDKMERDTVRWGCKVAGDTLAAVASSKAG